MSNKKIDIATKLGATFETNSKHSNFTKQGQPTSSVDKMKQLVNIISNKKSKE